MSPMHHSSSSPLQSSYNVQSYISAIHPITMGGSASNTLEVHRPVGLQRSVSLPLNRERTPPRHPRITGGDTIASNTVDVEVKGGRGGQGEPSGNETVTVLLRSSPMKEDPDSSAVELTGPTYAYRRRGALRNRRAFSQEVNTGAHLSPYFRPRNQSAGSTGAAVSAALSAAAVHRAAVLAEEEEKDDEKGPLRDKDLEEKEEEEDEEPNPLVESVKHRLLEQGHLSLLDVVEKMPTALHESIVTDNISQSCLDTITNRLPELQSGHLARGDSDSSRGAIHWFEGK